MMKKTNSRGKKQRIKKRIDKLEGKAPEAKSEEVKETKAEKKHSPQEKVQHMLKKREQKLQAKEDKKKRPKMNDEEAGIFKQLKNKKNNAKRERARETDDFDVLLGAYKDKVLKSISKQGDKGHKGADFEEIEMSDY